MLPLVEQEHIFLAETADRFLSESALAPWIRSPPQWSEPTTRRVWQELVDMGWAGLLFPENVGGLGLGLAEAVIIAERMGANLFPLPFGPSAILPALLPDDGPLSEELTKGVLDGAFSIGWLHLDGPSREGLLDHYGQCERLIISNKTEVGELQLRVVNASELNLLAQDSMDPCCPLAVWLPEPEEYAGIMGIDPLTLSPAQASELEASWTLYRLAELHGVASGALRLVLDYVSEREQFGQAIGSFQAVKHTLATAALSLETASLSVWAAAIKMDAEPYSEQAQHSVDCAHYCVHNAVNLIRHDVIHLHGAMGITWECNAHLYQKRMIRQSARLPPSSARSRLAATQSGAAYA